MGFDFEMIQPPDNAFGTLQTDGTWDGMINELIKDVRNTYYQLFKLNSYKESPSYKEETSL